MHRISGRSAYTPRRPLRFVLTATSAMGAVLLGGLGPPATAADATVDTSAAAPTLTEVVVTARRRAEDLEKVPATISVLSSADLLKRSVNTEADLQRSTPGLLVRESLFQNQLNFAIRGQSVDSYSSSAPGVLSYINEVQSDANSPSSFYDLSSVQVLKGPQGTLFGRNTTGGAVLFTTTKPVDTFGADALVRYGNYDDVEAQGDVNLPLAGGKAILRIAGSIDERNGYVRNIFDNSRLGDIDTKSIRATLLLKPTEQLQNQTMFEYTATGGTNLGGAIYGSPYANGQALALYSPGSPLIVGALEAAGLPAATAIATGAQFWNDFVSAHPGVPAGGLAAFGLLQQQRGPYVVDFNNASDHRGRNPVLTNETSYTVNPDMMVKNIFGYSLGFTKDSTDVDGTRFPIYQWGTEANPDHETIKTLQYSDEIQVQGKTLDHNLTYILGGYYGYEEKSFYIPEDAFILTPDSFAFNPASGALSSTTYDNKEIDRNEGLFFQGTYDLGAVTGVQGLHFTGGFRYTWEQIYVIQGSRSSFLHFIDPVALGGKDAEPTAPLSSKMSDPSWVVGLDYQVRPDLLVYVTQRGSWRSGGFNVNAPPIPGLLENGGVGFKPETTEDVEVGAKYSGRLGNLPFRLNVDVFNQWVDNIQRVYYLTPPGGGPAAFTINVPRAEVSGAEADGELRATSWLTVGANASYQDARFTSSKTVTFGQTQTFGPYGDAPRWSGSVFAELALPLLPPDMGELSLRGDVYGQSKFYFSNLNNTVNPGSEIPGYDLANFRLNWSNIAGSRFGAALFVKNAFNKLYYTGGLPVGSAFGVNTAVPGLPRFYGFELRAKF
jgi:iron complex outermembrane receptor protein